MCELQVAHMPGLLGLGLENALFPSLMAGLRKYKLCTKDLAEACMYEHAAVAAGRPCIMHSMLDELVRTSKTKNEAFSTAELISEASLLIVAGKLVRQFC